MIPDAGGVITSHDSIGGMTNILDILVLILVRTYDHVEKYRGILCSSLICCLPSSHLCVSFSFVFIDANYFIKKKPFHMSCGVPSVISAEFIGKPISVYLLMIITPSSSQNMTIAQEKDYDKIDTEFIRHIIWQ